MATSKVSDQVRGKTIRLSWTDGPTKGTTQEHIFHEDGTVEWHSVGSKGESAYDSQGTGGKAMKKPERPSYAGEKVADDVCMISYLSESGYTLTVVLNFGNRTTVGVASNEKTWVPVHGRFEVVS
jgi:hypothetical protein